MPLKGAEATEEPALNLTPMIDIVFLLIIFFMVGAQFTEQERQYNIQLPTSSDIQPLTGRPDELLVSVGRDGAVLLGGQPRTLEELEAELRSARENYEDQGVVIRGEGGGQYQPVMDVLSACHRAGIQSISLAYQVEQEDQ